MSLTVDSGTADAVILSHMLAYLEALHTEKVETEYEVANGEVVHNPRERRCMMGIPEKSKDELEIAFQVVEDVPKPLLAINSIVKQRHQVVFALESPIYFSSQESRYQ